jgi:arylsulfatase A-like enzyme
MNLYDVHAPYSPSMESPVAPIRSFGDLRELLTLPGALLQVSAHAYLRRGFRMSRYVREMLLSRYHRAIELMDRKLAVFYEEASRAGLLDDTVLILTSDHGEAFGEHGLYFHDASVYDTHLHVPLWIHHPDLQPDVVDDVVSTRDLFGLFRGLAHGSDVRGTLLDRTSRSTNPVALAEHFHYPYTDRVLPEYTQNIAAAIVGKRKIIVRREGPRLYDLARDPDELAPEAGSWRDFEQACRRDGAPRGAIRRAAAHVEAWLARVPSTTLGSRTVAVAL